MYKIIITKLDENKDYEEKTKRLYGYSDCEVSPDKYIEIQTTLATLTEEQWQKVQKAIIEAL